MEQNRSPRSQGQRPSMDSIRPSEKPAPAAAVHPTKARRKIPLVFIGGLMAVILLVAGGWLIYKHTQSANLIDTSKYQAVLLANGQWYFGKLQEAGRGSYKLTDVFYLEQQNGADNQQSETKQLSDTTKPVLVKLGSEIHAPEDSMIIKSDQLIFYENIKDSGQVATLMKQYMDKNKN